MKPTSEFDGDKALHVENCCGVLSILLAIEFHHVVLEIFGWFTPGLKPENLKGAEVLLDGLGAKHRAAEMQGVELAEPSRSGGSLPPCVQSVRRFGHLRASFAIAMACQPSWYMRPRRFCSLAAELSASCRRPKSARAETRRL